MRHLLLATAALVALAGSPAAAASYSFSFSNVTGAVAGTVSGTIELPDGDGIFAATQVLVTSYPAALGLGPAPVDALAAGFIGNSFTVSGGSIISSDFSGLINGTTALGLADTVLGGGTFLDLLDAGDVGATGVQDIGSTTLRFGNALSAAVPLPAALPLLLSGIAGLAGLGALRRRAA